MEQLANADDKSSYIIQCDFTDDSGEPVSPVSATWTLTDGNGDIVNTREDQPITALNSTIYIALSGDDLDVDEDGARAKNMRCLIVEATYNSTLTGGILPLKKAVKFQVTDLPQV